MSVLMDKTNGWMTIFRVVTPTLLGLLIWIASSSATKLEKDMEYIRSEFASFRKEYVNELILMRERLVQLETRQHEIYARLYNELKLRITQ